MAGRWGGSGAPAPHLLQHLSSRTQAEQRQSGGGGGNRLQHLAERLPLGHSLRSAQIPDHCLEVLAANADTQLPLRQQNIPVAVGNHRQRLVQSPENLGKRVRGGPTTQPTPERWSGLELIAITLKTMGRTAGLAVGFKHQNLFTGTGTQAGTAETTDSTTDHHNVDFAAHPPTNALVIIVSTAL